MDAAAPAAATAVAMKMHTEAGFNFTLSASTYGGGSMGGGGIAFPGVAQVPPVTQYQAAINWAAKNVAPGNLIEIKVLEVSAQKYGDSGDLTLTLAVVYWG